MARTRDRRQLRFSASADPSIEQAYRTHWISPELSERKRARLLERESRPPDLVVIDAIRSWTCAKCRGEFGAGALLMMGDGGPHCMDCADLGHLEYLPAGDATLTRRAKRLSKVSAVVVRWSRSRRRYERGASLLSQRPSSRPRQSPDDAAASAGSWRWRQLLTGVGALPREEARSALRSALVWTHRTMEWWL